jgi:hypothetical protein
MFDLPCHDEIAWFAWTTFNERWFPILNRIIEFSTIKPKALINEPVGVLDEDHVWITRMARIEYVQIHSAPMADLHVSKLNSLVPFTTKHATRLVKVTIIYSSASETCRKERKDDKPPS